MEKCILITGWWYTYPSEKYDFVRLDHHPNENGENIKAMFQTTNQMAIDGQLMVENG